MVFLVIAGLMAVAIALIRYFHCVLEQGTPLTHFFYVPGMHQRGVPQEL